MIGGAPAVQLVLLSTEAPPFPKKFETVVLEAVKLLNPAALSSSERKLVLYIFVGSRCLIHRQLGMYVCMYVQQEASVRGRFNTYHVDES